MELDMAAGAVAFSLLPCLLLLKAPGAIELFSVADRLASRPA